MRAASFVWSIMLDPNGRFKEANSSTIEFPDDSPGGMSLLLHVVHYKFNVVWESGALSADEAEILCELADKYNVMHLLTPFMTRFRITRITERVSIVNLKGFYISYLTGTSYNSKDWLRELAWNGYPSNENTYVCNHGRDHLDLSWINKALNGKTYSCLNPIRTFYNLFTILTRSQIIF